MVSCASNGAPRCITTDARKEATLQSEGCTPDVRCAPLRWWEAIGCPIWRISGAGIAVPTGLGCIASSVTSQPLTGKSGLGLIDGASARNRAAPRVAGDREQRLRQSPLSRRRQERTAGVALGQANLVRCRVPQAAAPGLPAAFPAAGILHTRLPSGLSSKTT